jgi:lysophospholipase L1-like esterase
VRIDSRIFVRSLAGAALFIAAACGSSAPPTQPTPSAPQITCPIDVTVSNVATVSEAVTYTAPTVTNGTAPVTTTCAPASGSTFALGTSTVNCTATDAQSRQAACTFKVTLKGFTLGLKKIDAFGDSFTEGENALSDSRTIEVVDPPNSYPTKLQARIDETYPGQGITVVNRGQNGEFVETTANVKMPQYLPLDRPDTVLLLSGYNNLLNGGCQVSDGQNPACGKTIDTVGLGIRDCIRRAQQTNPQATYIFVSTLTPPGPLVPPSKDRRLRPDVIVQMNTRIKQVVAAEHATLVDSYPSFIGHEAEYVSVDGLHLRPAGYQALADAFFGAIQNTVPQTPLFGFIAPR